MNNRNGLITSSVLQEVSSRDNRIYDALEKCFEEKRRVIAEATDMSSQEKVNRMDEAQDSYVGAVLSISIGSALSLALAVLFLTNPAIAHSLYNAMSKVM